MVRQQFTLNIHPEIIVDNFAGGGGASTGIELALGRCVDAAINHDPEALALHEANHPQTRHYCEDVWEVDPREVAAGRPVGLAHFSPDCKDHSKAKGGRPRNKRIRGLAWVAVKWAGTVRPRVMTLENVEEFQEWGPLIAKRDKATGRVVKMDGTIAAPGERVPLPQQHLQRDPKRCGMIFRRFVSCLKALGYQVDAKEIRACDHGAPTIRKRFFLIARCDGQPIVWPEATHGSPKSVAVKKKQLLPWRTAAECIDWSLPCPSIFERKRPLAEATLRRIARGIRKFVIESPEPFIVKVNHTAAGYENFRGQSMEDPLDTVTGKNGYGLAVPHVTKFRTGSTGSAMDEPLPTVTAGGEQERPGTGNGMGIVEATIAPVLVNTANGKTTGRAPNAWPMEEPTRTITSAGGFAVAAATLIQTGYGERNGQAPRVLDLEKPLGTIVADGQKHATVAAFLAKHFGGHETPGASLHKPADTITAVDHHSLVTAQIVGCGGRAGQSEPRDVSSPMQTVTAKADSCVVTSHLSKMFGTTTGQDMREPMHTVTGGGNHIAEVRAFLIKYYGEGSQGQSLHAPMHTIPAHDRIGLVTIAGEEYVITDIGMRMLEPHELFAAQGFPREYIIAPPVEDRRASAKAGHRVLKRMPKHAQVRMCGNSVSPPPMQAIVEANCPDLVAWEPGERKRSRAAA